MTSADDLDPEMKPKTDYMIDEGVIDGKPSKIVNLVGDELHILERSK